MKDFIKDLEQQVAKNPGQALKILTEVFDNNAKMRKQVLSLSARYQRYKIDSQVAQQSYDQLELTINHIINALLALIDDITEEEATAYQLKNAIFQRILVVCKTPTREQEMRRLFPERYYKGVEYDISGQPRPAESVNQFDLVVFDNFPSGEKEDPHELLRYYLDETAPLLLYFGTLYLPFLGADYPEKAYFTNSIFSIHSRIDEMLKYLEYVGKKN
ncbi:MAG: hypothetical protein AAGJ93_13160 [Bacteroidota bacterium]